MMGTDNYTRERGDLSTPVQKKIQKISWPLKITVCIRREVLYTTLIKAFAAAGGAGLSERIGPVSCHTTLRRYLWQQGVIPVYDELTEVDLKKMREEIDYRTRVLRPQLIEEVQTARAFGDLSENFEYRCAKQAKNRNDSRIRYLERMIRTAKVITAADAGDAVGLFDKVTVFNELLHREMTLRIVTTLRQDALKGLISKESPVGKALLGRKAGDKVQVEAAQGTRYTMEILSVEKGEDDESLDISAY